MGWCFDDHWTGCPGKCLNDLSGLRYHAGKNRTIYFIFLFIQVFVVFKIYVVYKMSIKKFPIQLGIRAQSKQYPQKHLIFVCRTIHFLRYPCPSDLFG